MNRFKYSDNKSTSPAGAFGSALLETRKLFAFHFIASRRKTPSGATLFQFLHAGNPKTQQSVSCVFRFQWFHQRDWPERELFLEPGTCTPNRHQIISCSGARAPANVSRLHQWRKSPMEIRRFSKQLRILRRARTRRDFAVLTLIPNLLAASSSDFSVP